VSSLSPERMKWFVRLILIAIGLVWLLLGSYVFGGIILGIGLVLSAIALVGSGRRA
jgi:hypothetical protein